MAEREENHASRRERAPPPPPIVFEFSGKLSYQLKLSTVSTYIATLNTFYRSTIDLPIHALIAKLKKAVLFVKFIYSDEMHCNNEFNRGRSKLFGYILPQTICWCALTHQFVDTGVMRK